MSSTCLWRSVPRPAPTSSSALRLRPGEAGPTGCDPRLGLSPSNPYGRAITRRLCKIKYYNNCLFYNVQANFLVQTGDPTNTGKGGDSVYGQLYGPQARFFEDEIRPGLKHTKRGMVGMASEYC